METVVRLQLEHTDQYKKFSLLKHTLNPTLNPTILIKPPQY